MANIINNTDFDKVAQTVANGKKDKQSLRKPIKLLGDWNLDPSKGYQFRTGADNFPSSENPYTSECT